MAFDYIANFVFEFSKVIFRGLNYNARGGFITSLNPGSFRTFLVIESSLIKGEAQELEFLLPYIK